MSVIKSIEQNIYDIEDRSSREIKNNELMVQKYKEFIQKQKKLYAHTIYRHANGFMQACNDVDHGIYDYLPKQCFSSSDSKVTIITYPFNPKHIVEFKKNGISMIDTWDKTRGILPSVYNQYEIKINTCKKNKYTVKNYCDSGYYSFCVDNYLNLYHAESDTYFMFNKLPFPKYSFVIRKNDFQHLKFIDEAIECFDDVVDNPSEHLDVMDYFKPTNYKEIYKYHNSFRKIPTFTYYPDNYRQMLKEFNDKSEYDVYQETEKLDDGLDSPVNESLTDNLMLEMIDEMNDICLKNETEINEALEDEELIMY